MSGERELAAQRYAAVGWPVFPVQPGEKIPAVRNGFKDATVDPDKISYWWFQKPLANVGIATGAPGPDVVDVDIHKNGVSGYSAWNQLKSEGLVDGHTAIVRTPSGGIHAYFAGSDQRNGHIAQAAVDFRSQGGYVVAPPSTVGGKPYMVVEHQASVATVDWGAIKAVLQPESQRRVQPRPERSTEPAGDVTRLASWVAKQAEGNRNHGLFYAACRAVEAGHVDLDELAEAGRQAGLSEREIGRTIDSARRTATLPFDRQADREAAS